MRGPSDEDVANALALVTASFHSDTDLQSRTLEGLDWAELQYLAVFAAGVAANAVHQMAEKTGRDHGEVLQEFLIRLRKQVDDEREREADPKPTPKHWCRFCTSVGHRRTNRRRLVLVAGEPPDVGSRGVKLTPLPPVFDVRGVLAHQAPRRYLARIEPGENIFTCEDVRSDALHARSERPTDRDLEPTFLNANQ